MPSARAEALVVGEEGVEELRATYLRRSVLWILPVAVLAIVLALALDLRLHGRVVSPVDAVALPLLALLFALGYFWILKRPRATLTVSRALYLVYLGYLLLSFADQHFRYFPRTAHYSEVAYWAYPAYVAAFLLYPRGAAVAVAAGLWGLFLLTSVAYALATGTALSNKWVQFHAAGAVAVGVTALLAMNDIWFEYARRLARTDALTGLPNRRAMQFRLEHAVRNARLSGWPLAVILFDLDDFKRINDEHGHWMGDRALRSLARALRDELRTGDTLGRWGGEEFLVILEGADLERARALAERLCDRVRQLSPYGIPLSASFGVAVWRPGESAEVLVARADRALYRAKEAGKGRVELAG